MEQMKKAEEQFKERVAPVLPLLEQMGAEIALRTFEAGRALGVALEQIRAEGRLRGTYE